MVQRAISFANVSEDREIRAYVRQYQQQSDVRLQETLQEYKLHCEYATLQNHRLFKSTTFSQSWQTVKEKHNICVYHKYRERLTNVMPTPQITASTNEFTRDTLATLDMNENLIKASGYMHNCTVPEVLRGVLASTSRDLTITQSVLHPNSLVQAQMLNTNADFSSSFLLGGHYMPMMPEFNGFFSAVYKFPKIPISILSCRRFTFFNRIGNVYDHQNGAKFGYYMLEAVDPNDPILPLHADDRSSAKSKKAPLCTAVIAGSLSFTWLLKQVRDDLIEVFAFGDFDLGPLPSVRLERSFIAQHLLQYIINAQRCYQAKLCTLILRDPTSREQFRQYKYAERAKHRRHSLGLNTSMRNEASTCRQHRLCSICGICIASTWCVGLPLSRRIENGKLSCCQACALPVCKHCCTEEALFSNALLTKYVSSPRITGSRRKPRRWSQLFTQRMDTDDSEPDVHSLHSESYLWRTTQQPMGRNSFDAYGAATFPRSPDQQRWQNQMDFRLFGRLSDMTSDKEPIQSEMTLHCIDDMPPKGLICLDCKHALLPSNISTRVLLMHRQQLFGRRQKERRVGNHSNIMTTPLFDFLSYTGNESVLHENSANFTTPAADSGSRLLHRYWRSIMARLYKTDRAHSPSHVDAPARVQFVPAQQTIAYDRERFLLHCASPSTLSIGRTRSKTIDHLRESTVYTNMSQTCHSLEENRRFDSFSAVEDISSANESHNTSIEHP